MADGRFSCAGCGKSYAWKPELAGKRVKCKCGHVMTAPASAPGASPEDDALYDIAPEPEKPKPRVPLAPVVRTAARESESDRPHPAYVAASSAQGAVPAAIGYQTGPTERQRQRMSSATLMDMKRDVHVPVALLIAGFVLYVGYYALRYNMGGFGIAMTGLGLGLLTAFKAALLIGFAFMVAGPLGVSFGGIWTAALKLAAVAVFSDGVATWIDAGVAKVSGGAGGAFGGYISFPIVLGLYWVLLIYLFSMDPGDSWLVVILLAVFDMIVRWALLLMLLAVFLNWGGVSGAALPALGGAATPAEGSVAANVADLKDANRLREAREYIAGGRQMALTKPVEGWYAAGAKNVWFEVHPDLEGKFYPTGVIVEMPKEKDKRARILQVLDAYLLEQGMVSVDDPDSDADDDADEQPADDAGASAPPAKPAPPQTKDDGEPYLIVPIRR